MRQALSDVRVVEIGRGFAAGWCGKAFADLGADVVKVEPPDGDELRADRGLFAHLNTNKRSAVVEVAPGAAPSIAALLDGADLVIETPGMRSLADWGIDARRRARARSTGLGAGHQRVRRDRALCRLCVERPGRAGVQRRGGRHPARSAEAPDVARRDRGRSHRGARCAGGGPARPCHRRRRVRRLRGRGGARRDPVPDRAVPRLGVPRPPRDLRADRHRHAPAARHLPLRRRLRGDDDDDAAAGRDADRPRE